MVFCDVILATYKNYLQIERNRRYLKMVVAVTKRENYQKIMIYQKGTRMLKDGED